MDVIPDYKDVAMLVCLDCGFVFPDKSWNESRDNPDSEDIDSESEMEIDESEEYEEEWF